MNKPTRMAELRAELLNDVAAHVAMDLIDHGIDADVAEQCGASAADHLADNWGGQVIPFPKDYYFRLAKRDRVILMEHTGNNLFELARKYNMTTRGIRKLLKRAEVRRRDESQGKLFDDD